MIQAEHIRNAIKRISVENGLSLFALEKKADLGEHTLRTNNSHMTLRTINRVLSTLGVTFCTFAKYVDEEVKKA